MLVVTNGEELKKGGREVWSTLVEKAVAKLFGNYGELLNSKCGIEHFLDFLIGVPRKEYILKKNV